VQSRVIQLKPRAIPIGEASALYRAALYDECLGGLNGHDSAQARALRIRALTKLGRLDAALALCSEIDPQLPHLERGELYLLKAVALLRLGRIDDVQAALLEARVAAYSSCTPALEADYETTEAHFRYCRQDYDAAALALDRALSVSEPAPLWLRHDRAYFLSLGLVRARAFDLRKVLAQQEGLRAQLHWARMALNELDAEPREDQWVYATLLSNFALLAKQAGDAALIEDLQRRLSAIDWKNSMGLQRFNIVRSLGWLRALAGDHLGAFREFRSSAEFAPSKAWKLCAVLDRSFLARELGQDFFAEEELLYALELAKEIDWSLGREAAPPFTVLVQLAQLVGARYPGEGRAVLNRYRAARAKSPATAFNAGDRGWQSLAEAIITPGEGRTQLATDLFVNAFDGFDKLGSRWLAALAALELAEITGQPFFHAYASREASRRPQSWLARRLAALPAAPATLREAALA
jgi:hypothetical protein